MNVKDRLAAYGDFVDVGVLHHGLASHMRGTVTKLSDEVHVVDKTMFPLDPDAGK